MIRVKAGVFSITPPTPPDDDGSYLRWHLLDHMPEQYQLPGLAFALRWIADGDYPAARIAANGHVADVGHIVHYLMGDPVQQTYDDFIELGGRLREIGRFPVLRPALQMRLLALLRWYSAPAALISPEVVPFRPHRGVVVIIEEPADDVIDPWLQWLHAEHYPALLAMPGVAGAWMFGATRSWRETKRSEGGPQYTTVVYLDDDPLATTKVLAPIIEGRWASAAVRPLFAGPLRTMISWEAWT